MSVIYLFTYYFFRQRKGEAEKEKNMDWWPPIHPHPHSDLGWDTQSSVCGLYPEPPFHAQDNTPTSGATSARAGIFIKLSRKRK